MTGVIFTEAVPQKQLSVSQNSQNFIPLNPQGMEL